MKSNILILLLGLVVSNSISANPILFIDDDEGLNNGAWYSTLSGLGYSFDVETLGIGGNSISNFSDYSTVIWSIGDRDTGNLTASNVSTMKSYLDSGGNLLYTGGHNLYNEPNFNVLAGYFGVSNYHNNMPNFGTTTMSGVSTHDVTGSNTYNISDWAGLQYGTMMTGFSVTTAEAMIHTPTSAGPYVAASNLTSSYNTMIWGFDLNMISNQAQRTQVLGDSLEYLNPVDVPEPSTLAIFALGVIGLASHRFKKQS